MSLIDVDRDRAVDTMYGLVRSMLSQIGLASDDTLEVSHDDHGSTFTIHFGSSAELETL